MRFNIKLLEDDNTIIKFILDNIQKIIAEAIDKAIPNIEREIKALVSMALRQEPEYVSLMSGELKAEFGIPNSSDVDSVIDALTDTLSFEKNYIKTSRSGLSGGFKLTMMKSDDMNGVINIGPAHIMDNNNDLPWLEWLLYKNNNIIVRNYNVKFGESEYSRSGLAIMVPSNYNWRVPTQFAGSIRNNWTTRAVSRIETSVYDVIKKAIEANL